MKGDAKQVMPNIVTLFEEKGNLIDLYLNVSYTLNIFYFGR